jgi:hypothetical protein
MDCASHRSVWPRACVPLRGAGKRRAGRHLHQADCLVAAAVVGVGAGLATANITDFPMGEVSVEHWRAGA